MSTTETDNIYVDYGKNWWSFTEGYAPRAMCRACGKDFSSGRGFDAHRVGEHEHLFSEEHPEGRRCLEEDELRERGYEQDAKGRWFNVERREQARAHFRATV